MVISCNRCGTIYNKCTVSRCPACNIKEIKDEKYHNSEIRSYMFGQIGEKRKNVNSYRASEVSKYERQSGKKVF